MFGAIFFGQVTHFGYELVVGDMELQLHVTRDCVGLTQVCTVTNKFRHYRGTLGQVVNGCFVFI